MTQFINYQPVGYIDVANITKFESELMKAVNSQEESVILVDMKKVEFLDSAGLMALVTAYKTAQNRRKRFSICSISPSVRIIFELSQLDKVFEIFENQRDFEKSLTMPLAA